MAADRTLMSWIRTSLSMLSFSFTIYRILSEAERIGKVTKDQTPREAGLFLAVMGTAAMFAGAIEYIVTLMQAREVEPFRIIRPTLIMSFILAAAGVGLFFGIAFSLI